MPTQPFTSLCVIAYVNWLAKDLNENRHLPVTHSLGLDLRVPENTSAAQHTKTTAFWVPMPNAARLIATTGHNPFTTPGPTWLGTFPHEGLRRNIEIRTLAELKNQPLLINRPLHIKPADVKIPTLPARVYQSHREFLTHVTALPHLPETTLMQTSPVMNYDHEVRCFITDKIVTAGSVYLHQNQTWDAWTSKEAPCPKAGMEFAQNIIQDVTGPRGYVLDVGLDTEGNWSVIEANPAWSSNPYHAAPDGVVTSICASQHPQNNSAGDTWRWKPADFLTPRLRNPLPIVQL